jgi:hypothetical protein
LPRIIVDVILEGNWFYFNQKWMAKMTVYKMGGKEGVDQEDEKEKTQFSVRFDNALVNQIDARRKLSKRSRNAEVEYLVEKAIEAEVERDREIVRRMADKNSTLQSNQS